MVIGLVVAISMVRAVNRTVAGCKRRIVRCGKPGLVRGTAHLPRIDPSLWYRLMRSGKISGLAIACAAMALPIWSDSAFAKADPAQPAPAPKAETKALQLSKAQAERIDDFVVGNLAFILLHEMAHALISEFDLRIPAKEEDTADRFAAYMMVQTRPMEELFKDAIIGWYARADQKKSDGNEFRSRHSPDMQRADDAVCLLYGSDPPRFKSLADEYKLGREVREPCNDDATNNGQSWFQMLSPKMIAGTLETRARVAPAGPEFIAVRPAPPIAIGIRPARMKHNNDKMPHCSNVQPALQQTQCWRIVGVTVFYLKSSTL